MLSLLEMQTMTDSFIYKSVYENKLIIWQMYIHAQLYKWKIMRERDKGSCSIVTVSEGCMLLITYINFPSIPFHTVIIVHNP